MTATQTFKWFPLGKRWTFSDRWGSKCWAFDGRIWRCRWRFMLHRHRSANPALSDRWVLIPTLTYDRAAPTDRGDA